MIYYAGIGSRKTPIQIQKLMFQIARHLSAKGFILRSGSAQGADKAFEQGCDSVGGKKEIYLPWANFESSKSTLIVEDVKAFEIAEKHHPYWHNLSSGVRKLQARNSHQILGKDLTTPVKFVVCYTEKGRGQGGTGQALRIAKGYNIPAFDCGNYEDDLELLKNKYREFYKITIS